MNKSIRIFLLALLAAPLSACALASVADSPAPQLFQLNGVAKADLPPAEGSETQILVDEFRAPAAIDTTRIVYKLDANEIKYYAEGRWSDRAPQMIQDLAVATLENSGAFRAVAARQSGLNADYFLVGDIREFAALAGADGRASETRVSLIARLVDARDGVILASRGFDVSKPVSASGINAVITAYDEALREVLGEIVSWSTAEAANAPRKLARTERR